MSTQRDLSPATALAAMTAKSGTGPDEPRTAHRQPRHGKRSWQLYGCWTQSIFGGAEFRRLPTPGMGASLDGIDSGSGDPSMPRACSDDMQEDFNWFNYTLESALLSATFC